MAIMEAGVEIKVVLKWSVKAVFAKPVVIRASA
jgi:hypothetical protein